MKTLMTISLAALGSASAAAQPNILDAYAIVTSDLDNSIGQRSSFDSGFLNPSIAPVMESRSAFIDEPLGGQHASSASIDVEAIGSTWSGSLAATLDYASGVVAGSDQVPGSNTPSISSFSQLLVEFSLDEPTQVDISALGSGIATGYRAGRISSFAVTIRQEVPNDSPIFFVQEEVIIVGQPRELNTSLSVMLDPGEYRFDAIIGMRSQDDTGGFRSATAELDFNVTFVPSPSSAAVLGLAGLAATRRRR